MTLRPFHLWMCCLVVSTGCGWLLEDYSGVLCNEDGSCPTGYFCAADTGRCQPGEAPVVEDAGVCANVSACVADDGCCPSGCNANNDTDCQPACGNGQVETDEVCDDGNTLNGDNCDPTCRYFNGVSVVSGVPGSRGYSDGPRNAARFQGPTSLAQGTGTLFVVDTDNATIRRIQLSDGTTSTVAGAPFVKQYVDGPLAQARFVQPEDGVFFDQYQDLYLRDRLLLSDGGTSSEQVLRRISLDGGVVETVDAGTGFTNLRGLGKDTQALLLLDDNGLRRWAPATGTLETVATAAQLAAYAGSNPCEGVTASLGGTYPYYLACRQIILRVDDPAGTISAYAGSPTYSGCSDPTDGGLGSATFYQARSLAWGRMTVLVPSPRTYTFLFVADPGCQTIRVIFGSTLTTHAGANYSAGYVDAVGDRLAARFNRPYSLAVTTGALNASPTVYVAEPGNSAVRQITGISTVFTTSPSGVATYAGAPPNTTFAYSDAGTTARYTQVTDLVTDGDAGVAYATSRTGGRVFQVSLDTGASEELAAFSSQAVAITQLEGMLYVALVDGTVRRLTPGSSTLELYAGKSGQTTPAVDGARTTTAVLSAAALVTDGKALFFVDDKAHSIRKLDPATNFVTTLAGGDSSAGPPAVADGTGRTARFENPRDLACDGQFLYTLDGDGSVVRRISIGTGEVTTIAGQLDVLGALDGFGKEARFAGARGLTTDGRYLFISDPGGGPTVPDLTGPTIRALDLRTLSVTTMAGMRGQWSVMAGPGTSARLDAPGPIAFDPIRQTVVFYDERENSFLSIR
ncbi:hypothetical protein JRI60_27905 [Archangium violaceum]|uniref:hypothetical protein n=1 Tax=Archangium violaceum TaxID=83451 RepID=UPI00194ED00A|nr:hypothetical protein [Archangium violaceum]QRN93030.1 hypothetical protein JRI60_27905 [Archangium violaceum]